MSDADENKSKICQYCFTPFVAANNSRIVYTATKKVKAIRRALKKWKSKKSLTVNESDLLSRTQTHKKHIGNYMVITCLMCTKKTKINIPFRKGEDLLSVAQGAQLKSSKEATPKNSKGDVRIEKRTPKRKAIVNNDVISLDSIPSYTVTNSLLPQRASTIGTANFISLSPIATPKASKKYRNPLSNKKEKAEKIQKKKRLSNLKRIIANNNPSPGTGNRLSDFLKKL